MTFSAFIRQGPFQVRIAPLEHCIACGRLTAFHVDRTNRWIGCAGAKRDKQLFQMLSTAAEAAQRPDDGGARLDDLSDAGLGAHQ
jgi:hypothetical protein